MPVAFRDDRIAGQRIDNDHWLQIATFHHRQQEHL